MMYTSTSEPLTTPRINDTMNQRLKLVKGTPMTVNLFYTRRAVVNSSVLNQVYFDEDTRTLICTFKNSDTVCMYTDKTLADYDALVWAESPGAWWNKYYRGKTSLTYNRNNVAFLVRAARGAKPAEPTYKVTYTKVGTAQVTAADLPMLISNLSNQGFTDFKVVANA